MVEGIISDRKQCVQHLVVTGIAIRELWKEYTLPNQFQFLTSLIKSKNINFNTEMIMHIQQFCLDFAKVPEANNLQKLVAAESYLKQQSALKK